MKILSKKFQLVEVTVVEHPEHGVIHVHDIKTTDGDIETTRMYIRGVEVTSNTDDGAQIFDDVNDHIDSENPKLEVSLQDILEMQSSLVENLISDMHEVHYKDVEKFGLDSRGGSVFMSHEYIAVHKDQNRNALYYNGFEYVKPEHISHAGDYVFYHRESSRIAEHINDWEKLTE